VRGRTHTSAARGEGRPAAADAGRTHRGRVRRPAATTAPAPGDEGPRAGPISIHSRQSSHRRGRTARRRRRRRRTPAGRGQPSVTAKTTRPRGGRGQGRGGPRRKGGRGGGGGAASPRRTPPRGGPAVRTAPTARRAAPAVASTGRLPPRAAGGRSGTTTPGGITPARTGARTRGGATAAGGGAEICREQDGPIRGALKRADEFAGPNSALQPANAAQPLARTTATANSNRQQESSTGNPAKNALKARVTARAKAVPASPPPIADDIAPPKNGGGGRKVVPSTRAKKKNQKHSSHDTRAPRPSGRKNAGKSRSWFL